jgi:hypothetical protein
VLVFLRHDPEENAHRFPGCLIVSANDKAGLVSRFLEDRRIVHLRGYFRPDATTLSGRSASGGSADSDTQMVGRKAVDDAVGAGAGVLLAVTVEVAMIGLYLGRRRACSTTKRRSLLQTGRSLPGGSP